MHIRSTSVLRLFLPLIRWLKGFFFFVFVLLVGLGDLPPHFRAFEEGRPDTLLGCL